MIAAVALALLAVLALCGLVVNAHIRPPAPPVRSGIICTVSLTTGRVLAIGDEPWVPDAGAAPSGMRE